MNWETTKEDMQLDGHEVEVERTDSRIRAITIRKGGKPLYQIALGESYESCLYVRVPQLREMWAVNGKIGCAEMRTRLFDTEAEALDCKHEIEGSVDRCDLRVEKVKVEA